MKILVRDTGLGIWLNTKRNIYQILKFVSFTEYDWCIEIAHK